MAGHLNFDDAEDLKIKIDEKANDLFRARPGIAPLQVNRHIWRAAKKEMQMTCFVENQDVWNNSQIEALRFSNDSSQTFIIRQERSWTTLNVSRELFEDLICQYRVFQQFWKCIFTFGRKTDENEFEFPGFRARHTRPSGENLDDIYESAYMLRRVERNKRVSIQGQDPWSIRQTAVYHKFQPNLYACKDSDECAWPALQDFQSTFLLINPSKNLELKLGQKGEQGMGVKQATSPWDFQRLLVSDSLRGWADYMSYLEQQLKKQSKYIILAEVGSEKENLSPLTDISINFEDRQTLKILEDTIIDLDVILTTLLDTVTCVREQCRKCCQTYSNSGREKAVVEEILEELDESVREAAMLVERAKNMKCRSESTAKLLSDLLSYEEAVALKRLSKESQDESKSMRKLTERSTEDAAAVKILTVITLIYLPTTIVANFFSTQFVGTDDSGHMSLSDNAWLFAAIGVPLTVFTVLVWWVWVRLAKVVPESTPQPTIEKARCKPKFPSFLSWKTKRGQGDEHLQRRNPFRTILSWQTNEPRDLEMGIVIPQCTTLEAHNPPVPYHNIIDTVTRSTTATTLRPPPDSKWITTE